MKTIFLLPILLLSLISTPCLSETMDELVERDGIYYKKFTETPFTGKITGIDSSYMYGIDSPKVKVEVQGRVENGKKEGKWVWYWKNGQLFKKGSYKNTLEEGEWVYYWDSGQLMSKGSYKNGKEEGEWVHYDYVLESD